MIIIDRRKEEQMKKVLAVLLVVLMLASLGAAAFADGDELMDMSFAETGITLHVPWKYLTGEGGPGILSPLLYEELGYNSGVYLTC